MKAKSDLTKIRWKDAVFYREDSIIPKVLPVMTTSGELYEETPEYFVFKNARTVSNVRKKKLPKDKVPFYFIPKSMVIESPKRQKRK